MEAHEYANLFPMMTDNQLSSMAESIRKTKQDHAITLFEGKILDGRNRWKACEVAGKAPITEEFSGTKEEALQFVLDHNLECRRHLSESQRAMIASRLATMRMTDTLRQNTAPPIGGAVAIPHKDRATAAADLSVGTSSLDRARRTQKTGVPELLKAVDDGDITVNAASEIAKLPAARQLEVLAEGPEAVKEKAKEIRGFGGEIAPSPKKDTQPDGEYIAPEPETKPEKVGKYIPDLSGQFLPMIFLNIDKISPKDIQFKAAMEKVITYCQNRIKSVK